MQGDRDRGTEEEERCFQHAMQPACAVELQQGSGGEERCTLVTGFLGAAEQGRANGAGSRQGLWLQAVLINTGYDLCSWDKAVAVPARLEVPSPVSSPSAGV